MALVYIEREVHQQVVLAGPCVIYRPDGTTIEIPKPQKDPITGEPFGGKDTIILDQVGRWMVSKSNLSGTVVERFEVEVKAPPKPEPPPPGQARRTAPAAARVGA